MTLRTISSPERGAVLDLLDQWISRDFFGRYFAHDPAFRDDLCFVAADGERLVSTLQVFTKDIRVNGATLRVGGVGNVFTAPAYREQRVASGLLTRAIAAMEEKKFDLSLLFAVRINFYSRLGWCSHRRLFNFIDPGQPLISGRHAIERFVPERDLDAIMALYQAYSGQLPGTTVRDRRYWLGQLRYAGNPAEDFLVARAGTEAGQPIVAYARATPLYDYYVVTEHGYLPGHAPALADLVCRLHVVEAAGWTGTLVQLAFEPEVLELLRQRGVATRLVEDVFWMWRLVSPEQLARKLGRTRAEIEHQDFFQQLLPPERSVFWLSDRF
ncbi:MAG: GNAT family N-acetyltransferase [Deltaproteobacteria bacterium]|nr:GNAT family N-acetyltransferase [Deltaproteobacteria bacterium]